MNNYIVFLHGAKSAGVLQNGDVVRLPVPHAIRRMEEVERKRLENIKVSIVQLGISLASIPKNELAAGDGEVLRAEKAWLYTLQRLERHGGEAVRQRQLLLERIFEWRAAKAAELVIAPANVLADFVAKKIAVSVVSDVAALTAAGVRISGLEELATLIQSWIKEFRYTAPSEASDDDANRSLEFADGQTTGSRWVSAVYKAAKNGKGPNWENSWLRFESGESVQTIAVSQESGKPVQPATIVGHVLEALTHGRPVSLRRLATSGCTSPPTQLDWEHLVKAEAATASDVTDPTAQAKPLVQAMGAYNPRVAELNLQPADSLSAADKAMQSAVYEKVRWFMALRRAAWEPPSSSDGSAPKRAKLQ